MVEKMVTITLPLAEAQRISLGLSDLACWCRGFNSALAPDDTSRSPFGAWSITEANIHFKRGIDQPESVRELVDEALTIVMRIAYATSAAARAHTDVSSHEVAAYIHDQVVNARLRLKGQPPLSSGSPWPFPTKEPVL